MAEHDEKAINDSWFIVNAMCALQSVHAPGHRSISLLTCIDEDIDKKKKIYALHLGDA